jgi:hypothetical protein
MWTQKLVKLTEQLAKQDLQISPNLKKRRKREDFLDDLNLFIYKKWGSINNNNL